MSVSSGGGYVRDGHNYKTLSDSSAHTISQTFITRPYHRTLPHNRTVTLHLCWICVKVAVPLH